MAACEEINRGARGPEPFNELKNRYMFVELTTRSKDVKGAATRFMVFLGFVATTEPDSEYIENYSDVMEEFLQAARKDLGIPAKPD